MSTISDFVHISILFLHKIAWVPRQKKSIQVALNNMRLTDDDASSASFICVRSCGKKFSVNILYAFCYLEFFNLDEQKHLGILNTLQFDFCFDPNRNSINRWDEEFGWFPVT